MIEAILQGERHPQVLATLREKGCKNDEATIARALQGNWRDDHLFALKQAYELYTFYKDKLAQLDAQIEAYLHRFEDHSDGQSLPLRRRQRKHKSNEPAFDMVNLLYRMAGVDLTIIDGIGGHLALGILSEIGLDMNRWPSAKHFASWLCLSPGNHKSGGKPNRRKTGTRPSANRAAQMLRLAAMSLSRSDSALGAYYRRLRGRLGGPKAITATAHKLAKIVYHMLKHGKPYVDRGAQYYEEHYRQRAVKNLRRRAQALGFTLQPVL